MALKFGKATHFSLSYKDMEPDEVAEVLESRRHVRDLVCVHGNPGIVWHPGEGPNQSDKDRSVTVSDCYVVSLEELKAVEAHIDETVARKSVQTLALKCMGIKPDPSVDVPMRFSCRFLALSEASFIIDGSF